MRKLVFGANTTQKINIYHWKCVGKGLGVNGMNELVKWKGVFPEAVGC